MAQGLVTVTNLKALDISFLGEPFDEVSASLRVDPWTLDFADGTGSPFAPGSDPEIGGAGQYAATGAAGTLEHGFPVNAQAGAYTKTGVAATLEYGHPFVADPGVYVLTGGPATLAHGFALTVDLGVYLLSGLDADIRLGNVVKTFVGVYGILGQDALLEWSPPSYPNLLISFVFGEQPQGWQVHRFITEYGYEHTRLKYTDGIRRFRVMHKNMSPTEASTWITFWESRKGRSGPFFFTNPRTGEVIRCRFAMTTEPQVKRMAAQTYEVEVLLDEVLYVKDIQLSGDVGSYVLTGVLSNLTKTSILIAELAPVGDTLAHYDLTGSGVALKYVNDYYIPAIEAGVGSPEFTYTGFEIGFSIFPFYVPGEYLLQGASATFVFDHPFDGGAGSYAAAGASATLVKDRALSAGVGSYAVNGAIAGLFKA